MSKPLIFDLAEDRDSGWSLETENHYLRKRLYFQDLVMTAIMADLEATKKELESYKNGQSTSGNQAGSASNR